MKRSGFISLLFVLALGCGGEEPLPSHQAAASTAADPGTVTPATSPAATPPPAAPSPVAPSPGAVVASSEGEKSGLALNVTELKRGSGGTVMLRFTIVNNSDQNLDFGYDFGDRQGTTDYNTVGGVHMIDPVGKKKYFVVRDAESHCVCSRDLKSVKPGESRNLWAKFPAPPPEVQRVTLVVPHFIPMDDVPIS